jgi:hypothetical protein
MALKITLVVERREKVSLENKMEMCSCVLFAPEAWTKSNDLSGFKVLLNLGNFC